MTMEIDGDGFAGKLGGFGDKDLSPRRQSRQRRLDVSGCCSAEHRCKEIAAGCSNRSPLTIPAQRGAIIFDLDHVHVNLQLASVLEQCKQ